MMLIILGLAVIVTMMVMGKLDQSQTAADSRSALSVAAEPNEKLVKVYYALTYIPAGSTIESKQIEQSQLQELRVFDDSVKFSTDVVGRKAKHAIPVNGQIRSIDLE